MSPRKSRSVKFKQNEKIPFPEFNQQNIVKYCFAQRRPGLKFQIAYFHRVLFGLSRLCNAKYRHNLPSISPTTEMVDLFFDGVHSFVMHSAHTLPSENVRFDSRSNDGTLQNPYLPPHIRRMNALRPKLNSTSPNHIEHQFRKPPISYMILRAHNV